ncbi:phage tail protein [Roseibium aggregatum]|uniref:Phage-related protein n=1 Tax=Roseibium aggregatum TaxID=187304 RepID=A0A0M6Y8A7_9HYPH|nr:Phage-related protein [Roseibium aggregatum]
MPITFNPSFAPSYPAQEQVEFKVLEAPFGDSYRQRAPDGLNSTEESYKLRWEVLPLADGEAIYSWLLARKGVEAFEFTIPGDSGPKVWTCQKLSRSRSGPNHVTVTADFRREYDL